VLALASFLGTSCGCHGREVADAGSVDDAGDAAAGDAGDPAAGWDAGPPPVIVASGCWSTPIVLAPPYEVAGARVVALPQGDALVVWVQFGNLEDGVVAQRIAPSGRRGPRQVLAPRLLVPRVFELPWLASNPKGDAVAVWRRFEADGGGALMTARFAEDAGWGPTAELETGGFRNPRVALTNSGEAFVAWSTVEEFSVRVRRTRGGRFLPTETVSAPGFRTEWVSLAASDATVLAWSELGPFTSVTKAIIWAGDERRDTVIDGPAESPGRVGSWSVAAWGSSAVASLFENPERYHLFQRTGDAGWRRGPAIEATLESVPRPFVGPSGDFEAWYSSDARDGGLEVVVRRFDGTTWSEPERVATQSEDSRGISSVSNGRGHSATFWSRGQSLVVLRRWADGGVVDSIGGLAVGGRQMDIAVAPTGDLWLVAQADEPEFRFVLLHCPAP
jgi:hypothetical protein